MKINQICSSCKSVYSVADSVYKALSAADRVSCPCCGHANTKQNPLNEHGSQSIHPAKAWTSSGVANSPNMSAARSFSRTMPQITKPSGHVSLDALKQKISSAGRCFILGTAPGIYAYDLSRLAENKWPVIGMNDAFRLHGQLDALVMADYRFIMQSMEKLVEWQKKNFGHIFWMRTTKHQGKELAWREIGGAHGLVFDVEASKEYERRLAVFPGFVTYFERVAEGIVKDLESPMRLNFHDSVVFSAINLAFLCGAKEVFLLGVELEDNVHADELDKDESVKRFPKGCKIIREIGEWSKELSMHDCRIYTCKGSGKLANEIPNMEYSVAVNLEFSAHLEALTRRVKEQRKVFLLGAGSTLNDLPLHKLCGWPVIGTNTAFLKYPLMDALVFGDPGFMEKYLGNVQAWQQSRTEKPLLFWHKDDERQADFCRVVKWEHANVNPIFDNTMTAVPRLSIRHSIITPAINLAYFLGAKEIYLCGVELNSDAHFWDPDEDVAKDWGVAVGHFPGGQAIADFIRQQHDFLKQRDVLLTNCSPGSLLSNMIPFADLEDAADPRGLNPNPAFGGQKKGRAKK